MSPTRVLAWFSCGAASAVAAKTAIETFSKDHQVLVVNCDTRSSEHPDNYRFSADCEQWFDQPIIHLHSSKFADVDSVIEKTRYMSGTKGARCTTELKKIPRLEFARPEDVHVFGFTVDETKRIDDFKARNPELLLRFILHENGIRKSHCYEKLRVAGIELPTMYKLGFDNNNCPGCVKASSPWYWDMVRTHFPDVFRLRCEQSRLIGCRLVEIHHHDRIFLDELPPGPFKKNKRENLSCGPECGQMNLAL